MEIIPYQFGRNSSFGLKSLLFLFYLFIYVCAVLCLVTQSCLTLCDPIDCSPARLLCPCGFSRQEYWSGLPRPPTGDFAMPSSRGSSPPGIKPKFPVSWADSLLSEPQGKPKILEWVAYPFSRGSSQPRNRIGVSCIAGGFFTSWATGETLFLFVLGLCCCNGFF